MENKSAKSDRVLRSQVIYSNFNQYIDRLTGILLFFGRQNYKQKRITKYIYIYILHLSFVKSTFCFVLWLQYG